MNIQTPVTHASATYQDILDAPAGVVAEIVDGALHTHPRPAPRHARASSKLGAKLDDAFDGDDPVDEDGWWILDEPELHLGAHVLVPDLAGWRRTRMPKLPDTAYFTLAPDWVCEVLSPATRRLDLTAKRALYGEAGVTHLWFVDPDARTLEAFENREGAWVLIAALSDDAEVAVAPFDSAPFLLGALWAD